VRQLTGEAVDGRLNFKEVKMRKRFELALVSVFVMVGLFGCAFNKPTGEAFNPRTLSNDDTALVYFYRPLGDKIQIL
jgi:hypothetical protein